MAKKKKKSRMSQQTRTALLIGGIFLGVVVLGVAVYFAAFHEPPPRDIVIRGMFRDMVNKLHRQFEEINLPAEEQKDLVYYYRYNPIVDRETRRRMFGPGDPRPWGDLVRRYYFDENALVLVGVPCTNVYDVYDHTHLTTNQNNLVPERCPDRNIFYYTAAPKHRFACRRCAFDYKLNVALGYRASIEGDQLLRDDLVVEPQDLGDTFEPAMFNHQSLAKGRQAVLNFEIGAEEAPQVVLPALTFTWIKWPDTDDSEKLANYRAKWEQSEEKDRVPLGFRGTIRFMEVVQIHDPEPRVTISRHGEQRPNRYVNITEPLPEDTEKGIVSPFHEYMLWRTNVVRVYEVDFEYRGGNISYKNLLEPVLIAHVDPYHRDSEIMAKLRRQEEERAEKLLKAHKERVERLEAGPDEPDEFRHLEDPK